MNVKHGDADHKLVYTRMYINILSTISDVKLVGAFTILVCKEVWLDHPKMILYKGTSAPHNPSH